MQLTSRSFSFEGSTRSFEAHIPTYVGAAPKAVICLHGGGGNGQQFSSKFESEADDGVWLIFPNAQVHSGEARWISKGVPVPGIDEHQDERFLLQMMVEINNWRANQGKAPIVDWYVTGFSSGGGMTWHLLTFQADKFRGFAPAGKSLEEAMVPFTPPAQAPVLQNIGTLDDNYEPQPGNQIGSPATMEWVRLHNSKCPQTSVVVKNGTQGRKTECLTYLGPGPDTRLVRVVNGGHAWFGSANKFGARTTDIVFDFFRDNGL